MGFVLTTVVEVVDGVAVGNNNTIIAPLVAQNVDEQTVAGAAGLTLETLIGAHHLAHITFLDQCLEGGQIGFPKVAIGGFYIH